MAYACAKTDKQARNLLTTHKNEERKISSFMIRNNDIRKTTIDVIAGLLVIGIIGIPLTALVWLCVRIIGFDASAMQVIGAEILYTIVVWWTYAFVDLLKGSKK